MTEPAGLWVRVSSGDQSEQNQLPDLERHAATHDYEIVKRYELHSKSAFHGKQQAYLDEALADMRAGLIKVLVVWHSDRIERRPGTALLDILAEFSAAGGRVESVQEPQLGALDMGSQITTFIAGLVNHEKSAHISQQTALGIDRIKENGGILGKAPFGLKIVGPKYHKVFVPIETLVPIVREIFERCIAEESYQTIAIALNKQNAGGRIWIPKSIGTLLHNPAYMGFVTDVSGKVTSRCEAIITADVFQRAQDAIANRPARGPVNEETRALLSGCLRCSRCGAPCYRLTASGTDYYRCVGVAPIRKSTCRNMSPCWKVDGLVNAIMSRQRQHIFKDTLIAGHDYQAELAAVDFELKHLPLEGLSEDEEDARRAELRSERKRLSGLESVPDSWVSVDTGVSYAEAWEALSGQERGAWLRREKIAFYLAPGGALHPIKPF